MTASAILVVNADDFGMTEGTNRAILDAFRYGIVTSTSLLANGYAFEHAADLARQNPSLGIGVHFTLTEGPSVAPDVAELVGANGKLPLSNQPYARALALGRLPAAAIRREFEAQAKKIIRAGIRPTHIDGHKYIHLLPGITPIAVEVAKQFGIPVMRVPHRLPDPISRPGRLPGKLALLAMATLAYGTARRNAMRVMDRTVGFVDTGHLSPVAVRRLLARPVAGTTELLCHPAYRSPQLESLLADGYRWIAGYDFDGETSTVADPGLRDEVQSRGWTLRSFAEI